MHPAFLERGFHGASLDEIAEEAGYSKGAVYSNFAGKDDLFLAVLDANAERRARALADVILDQAALEDSYRAVSRSIAAADETKPRWTPLLLEFWAHASRRPALRAAVTERRERFFTIIGGLIEELAARHGVGLRMSGKEAARGSSALARGIATCSLAPAPSLRSCSRRCTPPSAPGSRTSELRAIRSSSSAGQPRTRGQPASAGLRIAARPATPVSSRISIRCSSRGWAAS